MLRPISIASSRPLAPDVLADHFRLRPGPVRSADVAKALRKPLPLVQRALAEFSRAGHVRLVADAELGAVWTWCDSMPPEAVAAHYRRRTLIGRKAGREVRA